MVQSRQKCTLSPNCNVQLITSYICTQYNLYHQLWVFHCHLAASVTAPVFTAQPLSCGFNCKLHQRTICSAQIVQQISSLFVSHFDQLQAHNQCGSQLLLLQFSQYWSAVPVISVAGTQIMVHNFAQSRTRLVQFHFSHLHTIAKSYMTILILNQTSQKLVLLDACNHSLTISCKKYWSVLLVAVQ